MTFEIDDPCKVYHIHWRTARKLRWCECCCYDIPPGAQYQEHRYLMDGGWYTETCCWACAAGVWQLVGDYRAYPTPSGTFNYLLETTSRKLNRPDKAFYKDVRDVFAGVIHRSRAADKLRKEEV